MAKQIEFGMDTYKGNKLLVLSWEDDDRFPFSFGVGKCKMLKQALKQNPTFLDDFLKEVESDKD